MPSPNTPLPDASASLAPNPAGKVIPSIRELDGLDPHFVLGFDNVPLQKFSGKPPGVTVNNVSFNNPPASENNAASIVRWPPGPGRAHFIESGVKLFINFKEPVSKIRLLAHCDPSAVGAVGVSAAPVLGGNVWNKVGSITKGPDFEWYEFATPTTTKIVKLEPAAGQVVRINKVEWWLS